jgi:hypothetical protein
VLVVAGAELHRVGETADDRLRDAHGALLGPAGEAELGADQPLPRPQALGAI